MPAPPRTEISKDVAAMMRLEVWLPSQDHPCRTKVPPATIGVAALRVVQRRTPPDSPRDVPNEVRDPNSVLPQTDQTERRSRRDREARERRRENEQNTRIKRDSSAGAVAAAQREEDSQRGRSNAQMRRDAESPSIDEQSPQRRRDRSRESNRSAEDPGAPSAPAAVDQSEKKRGQSQSCPARIQARKIQIC